jgi:hypothetical protein
MPKGKGYGSGGKGSKTKPKPKITRGLPGIFGKIEKATEARTGSISMRKKHAPRRRGKK